jgi:hypothetical protein
MKTLLLAFVLCISVGTLAVAQDSPVPAPQEHQAAGTRLTSIVGNVSEQGEKLRFVTDQRAWNVDNPEILKGLEGHNVRVNAHAYSDEGWIHIVEVKMSTATESGKNNER